MSTHTPTSKVPKSQEPNKEDQNSDDESEASKSEAAASREKLCVEFSQILKQFDLPNELRCITTDTSNSGDVVTADLLCGTVTSSGACPLHIET